MKKRTLKKLILAKETVAHLDLREMGRIKVGQAPVSFCDCSDGEFCATVGIECSWDPTYGGSACC